MQREIILPTSTEQPDEKRFWRKLKRVIAQIPFAEDLVAAWLCALDPRTPAKVRVYIFGAIGYFILPADVMPDFILGMGYLDDASVIAAVISMLGSHIRPEHRAEARDQLDRLLEGGEPVRS